MEQALPPASRLDQDGWVEIRSSRGRLLCRLDASRLLLEVKPKGEAVELVDLRPFLVELVGKRHGRECNNLIDAVVT